MRARTYVPLFFCWSPLRFHWEPARAPDAIGKATSVRPQAESIRCGRRRARALWWRGCVLGRDGSYRTRRSSRFAVPR